jgi:hypothetical protein
MFEVVFSGGRGLDVQDFAGFIDGYARGGTGFAGCLNPEKGGSFYLQSKILRARERLEMEFREIERKAAHDSCSPEAGGLTFRILQASSMVTLEVVPDLPAAFCWPAYLPLYGTFSMVCPSMSLFFPFLKLKLIIFLGSSHRLSRRGKFRLRVLVSGDAQARTGV